MAAEPERCCNCDRTIGRMEQAYLHQGQPVCKECHARLTQKPAPPKAAAQAVAAPSPQPQTVKPRRGELACKACGGRMVKTTLSSGNCSGVLLGLIMVLAGILVTVAFFVTIIGPIIGILMVLVGLGMGGKTRKVWKCKCCGTVHDRA